MAHANGRRCATAWPDRTILYGVIAAHDAVCGTTCSYSGYHFALQYLLGMRKLLLYNYYQYISNIKYILNA